MNHGHGPSISVTMIMFSPFVSSLMDCHGGIRLSSFVIAELIITNENVDLPYFGGPWIDYQCHSVSGTTIIVTTISVWSRPRARPMRRSYFFGVGVQCNVLFL